MRTDCLSRRHLLSTIAVCFIVSKGVRRSSRIEVLCTDTNGYNDDTDYDMAIDENIKAAA